LGETALSAVSLANNFISVFQVMCMGLGMGAAVMTSRYFGMKDNNSLKKTITIMLRLCFLFATAFSVATLIAPGSIISIFTKEIDVINEGIRYLTWSVVTYWLLGLSLTLTIVLRSVGQAKLPLYASIIAFFTNVFFNYMFIFGKFGAPEMGVAGAALGTLISRVFEFGLILFCMFKLERSVCYRPKDVLLKCGDLLPEYIRVSIPVLVSDTLLGLGNSSIATIGGYIGKSFVSANAITMVTQQLSNVFVMGISQASCIIIGNTLGEGDIESAKKQGNTFLLLGIGFGIFAAGVITLISDTVIGYYNISDETKEIAYQLMNAVAFTVIFQCTNSMLTKGVMRGGGDTKFLMVADVLFLWIVSIPVGALAGIVWKWPPYWVFICLKLDHIIKAIWCVARLRSGNWIKKIKPVLAV